MANEPALGILEFELIARGIFVSDVVVKKALVDILTSGPVSGGKHLLMLRGGVAELEESMAAGRDASSAGLADSLMLPFADEQLWPLLPGGKGGVQPVRARSWSQDDDAESAAIVETKTVCAAVAAADAAAKCAPVRLRDMQLAIGISGKAFFTMTGRLHDIEASAAAATDVAADRLLDVQIIAQPADEIRGDLIR